MTQAFLEVIHKLKITNLNEKAQKLQVDQGTPILQHEWAKSLKIIKRLLTTTFNQIAQSIASLCSLRKAIAFERL